MGLFEFLRRRRSPAPDAGGPVSGGDVKFSGGDGLTPDTAVFIEAASHFRGVAAEYQFIGRLHGERGRDWDMASQALILHEGKKMDAITVVTREGEKTYYFDLSGFYGKG